MNKLRVWWIPQVGVDASFYVPVSTIEEGKKMLDTLAAYDAFQLQNRIKGDYCNSGGLQIFNEEEQEWNGWYLETEDNYFDNVDEYCESEDCGQSEDLKEFTEELFNQIDWEKIKRMTTR